MYELYQKSRGEGAAIKDEIERLYFVDYQYDAAKDLMMRYDELVENRKAVRIKKSDDVYSRGRMFFSSAASYYFCQLDKKARKNLIYIQHVNYPHIKKKYKKILNRSLRAGIYHYQLDKKNFVVLHIDNDDYLYDSKITTTMYFIGPKAVKLSNEFSEFEIKLRLKVTNAALSDKVISISTGGMSETDVSFKDFSQMIFNDQNRILEYIDNWKRNIPLYYDEYKIIPKLSILIYGTPGTGKSTFYQALTKYLGLHECFVITDMMNGRNLKRYELDGPVAIDDIDTFSVSRTKDESSENQTIVREILGFLDRPPTFDYDVDGTLYPISVIIATTNYIDKLDPAIKRSGRFDLKIEMTNFDYSQAKQFCQLYNIDIDTIIDGINKDTFDICPAELQALCVENIDKRLKEV